MNTLTDLGERIIKTEKQRDQYKRERDELITDIKKQRELLKDFSRFIHRKVEACPGKKEYMDFRDRLNELGIRERE
ncbi:hypothetical protein [Mammaliicoccus sciuri]|uniref:hypothetical protein n=1 Tax=Mammaliicoccus sciuri TaxID=1296 RepID=UPI001953BBC7|nr:hypothetical protein [Mammaliicoccus sciuri]